MIVTQIDYLPIDNHRLRQRQFTDVVMSPDAAAGGTGKILKPHKPIHIRNITCNHLA
jgi:hypothetical protein